MGVISGGQFNGDIVVNSNDGFDRPARRAGGTKRSSPTAARAVITHLQTERTDRCC